jgi:hypothetical protein
MRRELLTKSELYAARQTGERIEAGPRTPYSGQAVEHSPRKDSANNHPDFYPWHVIGHPDHARLRNSQVVATGGSTS